MRSGFPTAGDLLRAVLGGPESAGGGPLVLQRGALLGDPFGIRGLGQFVVAERIEQPDRTEDEHYHDDCSAHRIGR